MSLFDDSLPDGLLYLPGWLDDVQHDDAVGSIDAHAFRTDLSRRTQHYGFVYDYQSAVVRDHARAADPPDALADLAARLHAEGHFHRVPDQIIVNEYLEGQGISAHADSGQFGPVVATVSLLESWPMTFRHPDQRVSEVLLERCSLALMTGDSRSLWTHEIRKRKSDMVGGLKVQRHRRLSVTFRTVNAFD